MKAIVRSSYGWPEALNFGRSKIGGLNKGRPNAEDLGHAKEFAQSLVVEMQKRRKT